MHVEKTLQIIGIDLNVLHQFFLLMLLGANAIPYRLKEPPVTKLPMISRCSIDGTSVPNTDVRSRRGY
jgi:hypothetical protein